MSCPSVHLGRLSPATGSAVHGLGAPNEDAGPTGAGHAGVGGRGRARQGTRLEALVDPFGSRHDRRAVIPRIGGRGFIRSTGPSAVPRENSTRPGSRGSESPARRLVGSLARLRRDVAHRDRSVQLSDFGKNRTSARNLLQYLALRRHDLRRLQIELADRGLSSLGRAEGHTLYTIDAVLANLRAASRSGARASRPLAGLTPREGRRLLDRRARRLLGPARPGRLTRIMVTLPSEAATHYSMVRDLVDAGMDVARINCAHDDEARWTRMIAHVRAAEKELHRRCPVEMDLGGPKLRTGPLPPGPAVVKVRPHRDVYGRVTEPGHVWLTGADHPAPAPSEGVTALMVDQLWLDSVRVPGTIHLTDARGATRSLRLVARFHGSCEAETRKTVYVTDRTTLWGHDRRGRRTATRVRSVPRAEPSLRLRVGDRLRVVPGPIRVATSTEGTAAGPRAIPEISCTLPEVLPHVRVGDRIWFDDGKIGARAERASNGTVTVRVTHAALGGSSLRADRGVNLPDTDLPISSLTEEDLRNLPYVVRNADLVGYSFVRSAADVRHLNAELRRLRHPRLGVILKIETRRGFEALPAILLEALRGPPTGVMIARGDLAVEIGYERLAEVQEEILWLCEAAHLPVVWATEVLAELAKTGVPTRAEVTDAAMGERAECVMLNKGPHILDAVHVLDNILRRMEAHQAKKSARLRHLAVAERFFRG
jgi:pyruvate kinase